MYKVGYTHYWLRPHKINRSIFYHIMLDFKSLIVSLHTAGVRLAGPDGTMGAILRLEEIRFNGVRDCGHPALDVGIGWPSSTASGVSKKGMDVVVGDWMGGAVLQSRVCNGDCSHDSFSFLRQELVGDYRNAINGQCFRFCKTAYKPYDLAVCCALIIAEHHLGKALLVASDGTMHHYRDAIALVEKHLGYGSDFVLYDFDHIE